MSAAHPEALYAIAVPTIVDQALVIRHWDFSETSQTVSLFCREHGVLRGLAKGSRREKSRFSGGLEVLTRGEMVAITKQSAELATITEWDLQEVFWATRRDLGAHRAGLYIVDLIHHAILGDDPHPRLWDSTASTLRDLADPARRSAEVLRFQWMLLVELGYKPNLEGSASATRGDVFRFNPRAGGLVTGEPGSNGAGAGAEDWRVRADTVRLLRTLDAEGDATPGPSVAAPTIDRASRLLSEYLRVLLDRDLGTRVALFGPRA